MSADYDKEPSFVCFGGVDWWYHNRAHIDPQLTIRFARKGRTLYINSIIMTKLNAGKGKNFLRRLIRKSKSLFKGLKKTTKGFWVYSPFVLPVHHIWWAKPLNEMLLRLQIFWITWRLGIHCPTVLVANPAACDTAIWLKKKKMIYQRTDRFEEADGIDVDTIVKFDRKLKANSDLTIYVNKKLFEQESTQCKKTFFLDHGVDFDVFADAEKTPDIPDDMINIPKPIIGYFGSISAHSVDIALAGKIADLLPDMSFIYIGTVYEEHPGLSTKKNVWFLGQKDYEQIPHYGKLFDVAILPWVQNRWTEAANPIKVKEYLALGKPFVTTPVFTQLQEYLDVAYVADTPEEFARCIKKALKEDCPERVAARRQKVKNDTWDYKAELLLQELYKEQ
jgi:glycosyltransferase involved in cell wall biosynthesis